MASAGQGCGIDSRSKYFPAISLEVVRLFVTLPRQNISFDYPGRIPRSLDF